MSLIYLAAMWYAVAGVAWWLCCYTDLYLNGKIWSDSPAVFQRR